MSESLIIRRETAADYAVVEQIIRRAFYNLYQPGCHEHYLAHILRTHPDFVPELDLVAELDGRVIGNIMYTRSRLTASDGREKPILTFGPVGIHPDFQRRGYGKRLMEASFRQAAALRYDAIVIFGDPHNYVSRGFVSCKRHRVSLEDGRYPAAMLVKELTPGALAHHAWIYHQSSAFDFDEAEAARFDDACGEPLEKRVLPCQETFYILSGASL